MDDLQKFVLIEAIVKSALDYPGSEDIDRGSFFEGVFHAINTIIFMEEIKDAKLHG